MTARDRVPGASHPYRWFEGVTPLPAGLEDNGFVSLPLCFPRLLDADRCAAILELAHRRLAQPSSLGNPTEDYRIADSRWVRPDAEWQWVFDLVAGVFARANAYYRYDIRGMVDPLLVATYPEGGGFEWHIDTVTGTTSTRKIALSLQLSERDAYEGGLLEFVSHGELPLARDIGTVVCFPAFIGHRVTPVSRGTREALVAWAHGPAFR